ncbi:UNVERIFIED_CONTAM: hypothetical protein HDU68_008163 [Siphonaria sp. JEL0065]|nr:hypothetical protein HDU68_008163 [Siphonaria sp. JEL0065]
MDLREKAQEVTSATSDSLLQLMNESSVGLYRIQEHILKKTPVIVAEKKAQQPLSSQIELAVSDVREASELVGKMNRVTGFHRSVELLKGLFVQ